MKNKCKKHGTEKFFSKTENCYRCAKCRTESVIRYRINKKIKLIERAGGKCVLCGYNKFRGALQFHHLDRKVKSFAIGGKGITRSWKLLKIEAKKCILLCANCHAEVEGRIVKIPE